LKAVTAMPTDPRPFERLVETYVHAKDENRPHLIADVFAADARLELNVRAGSIAFPPVSTGAVAITDVLVRQFAQVWENVYTFCLERPEKGSRAKTFSCPWLVAMTAKADGTVRVGSGRYDWRRQTRAPFLVDRLTITIDAMQALPAYAHRPVYGWISELPYPWCPAELARSTMPQVERLEPVATALARFAHA
jgi:hypothetical protein